MKIIRKIFNVLLISFCVLCALIPFILIFISSFNTSVDIKKGNIFSNININTFFTNFNTLFSDSQFLNAMLNSFLIALITVFLGLIIASMAGYAFVTYRNKKTDKLFYLIFFAILIPSTVLMVPLFKMVNYIHLLNTYTIIVLTALNIPFMVYLFKQNTKLFPKELINMARIDGLNEFQIFFKIYLPNMKSVVITSMLLLFIDSWNAYLFPLIFINDPNKFTLPIYLNYLGSSEFSNYGVFMLGLFISTLPILIIFSICQKYFKMGMKNLQK